MTDSAYDTTTLFYAAEVTVAKSGTAVYTFDQGYGVTPNGTNAQFADNVGAATSVIRASDLGYRTSPSDGDPQVYPPIVSEAFAIDRSLNLEPSQSSVAAAWGTVMLSNADGQFDSIVSAWTNDGLPVTILYGSKQLENFAGYRTVRNTVAKYIDANYTMQAVAAFTLRTDYTSALTATAKATTNYIRNNTNVGAVVAGALPTNWSSFNFFITSGTVAVAGLGTETGLAYVDLTFSGTVTGSGQFLGVTFESNPGVTVPALTGQVWTLSSYCRLISGSFPTGTTFYQFIYERDSSSGNITAGFVSSLLPNSSALNTQRYTFTRTLVGGATVAAILPYIQFSIPTNGAFSFTVRIGGAQAEIGWPGGTNYLRNTTMYGAVNGAILGGGGFPSLWGSSALGGCTVTIVGTGVESGLSYLDVSFVGTPTSTGQFACMLDAAGITASAAQAWTLGGYMRLMTGSLANVTSLGLQLNSISQFQAAIFTPTNAGLITQPGSVSYQTAVGTTQLNAYLVFSVTNGAAISLTIRLGGLALERAATQGPWVATSGTAVTSGGPTLVTTTGTAASNSPVYAITSAPTVLNEGATTNYILSTTACAGVSTTVAATTEVSPLLSGATIYKHKRTATGSDSNTGAIALTGLPTSTTFRVSCYIWIPTFLPSKTSITIGLEGGGAGAATGSANLALTNQWQRLIGASQTLNAGVTATTAVVRVNPQVLGDLIYTTCWQVGIDTGSGTATSYIPASTTPQSRAADNNYQSRGMLLDPTYASMKTMIKGIQNPWFLSEANLQINIRDATAWLSRPVQTNLYLGTGTYQGTSSLLGLPFPMARGGTSSNPIRNVTPTLIDPTNQIYQYNDAAGTVVNLYEGASLTITRQTDTTNLYAGSTTAGQYRTDNSRGLFQLGSTPSATITLDCTGAFPIAGAQTSLIRLVQYLLTEELLIPAANISAAHYAAVAAAYAYEGGIYFSSSDSPGGLTALSQLLSGIGAKLYPARDGTLKLLVLRDPAAVTALSTGLPVATFNNVNTVSVIPQALPSTLDPPPYRMRVGYAHNYTVQTSGLLATTPPTAVHRQFVGVADSYAAASSSTVLTNYTRPNDPQPLVGALTVLASAQAVATDLMALWGARRRLYAVTVPTSVGLLRDLGDLVTVTWDMDDLGSGKLGVVVGEQFRSADSTITLQVLC